mmetsp:Transcript_10386/g.25113  ORF Transcript_10386/g.25113 Transcript_10386/m.25113 type:complete len:106 (+) Transcript_10386:677-994(+)
MTPHSKTLMETLALGTQPTTVLVAQAMEVLLAHARLVHKVALRRILAAFASKVRSLHMRQPDCFYNGLQMILDKLGIIFAIQIRMATAALFSFQCPLGWTQPHSA